MHVFNRILRLWHFALRYVTAHVRLKWAQPDKLCSFGRKEKRLALKNMIRPLVPPILWSAMSRVKGVVSSAGSKPQQARSPQAEPTLENPETEGVDFVSGERFAIVFEKIEQSRGTYFVPGYAKHRPACQAILSGDVYEPATHALIDKIMQRKPGSIVHAGTFFGDMLPTFARSCPAKVYAFEPVLENYVLAKLCVEANTLDNVLLQNVGLSDTVSVAKIDTGGHGDQHRGGTSRLGDTGQLVSLVTIDSFDLDDVAVIQLDVEGHELSALKGARATIERNSPIVMVEDNEQACSAFLEELSYVRVRKIPGLFIWAPPAEVQLVKDLLPRKKQNKTKTVNSQPDRHQAASD